ncbi:MAG: hypothetical protein C0391_03885 [Anaerolinea sp.]|nr:hypothetical protein [Anaerolinea sp.]
MKEISLIENIDSSNEEVEAMRISAPSQPSPNNPTDVFGEGALKLGARNNSGDKARVLKIREMAIAIQGLTDEMEPGDAPSTSSGDEGGHAGPPLQEAAQKSGKKGEDEVSVYQVMAGEVVAVKGKNDDDDTWELDILAAPYYGPNNGKDIDKQYFSPNTKFHEETLKSPLIVYFHGWSPEGKPMGMPEIIGSALKLWKDAKGLWYRIKLDKVNAFAKRAWAAAKEGTAKASSGSLSHLVRIAKDGEILNWPLAEISLIDTGKNRFPANAFAVALPVMKAHYEGISALLETEEDAIGAQPAQSTSQGEQAAVSKKSNQPPSPEGGHTGPPLHKEGTHPNPPQIKTTFGEGTRNKETKMTPEEIQALFDKAIAAHDLAQADALKAQLAEKEKIDAAVKAEKEKWEAEAATKSRLNAGAPHQAQFADTWKYDNYSPAEIGLAVDILRSNKEPVSPAMIKALALKCSELKDSEESVYVKSAMKKAGLEPTVEAIKAATDPMYTGGSLIGSDWVGAAYAMQIWGAIRAARQIVPKIPSVVIPDGYSSEYFPLEGADPTWYKVAETSAADSTMKFPTASVTASQAATARKQITVAKMGARAMYSGEMVEDSLLPFAAQLQEQLQQSGGEMLEHVVIDGDTTTTGSTNINDIGNSSTQTATNLHLVMDGFRKLALVTNTANSRSAAGSLTVDDFIETLWLMGTAGLAVSDPTKCAFIIDPNVLKAASKLPEVLTRDVNGVATLENGWLKRIWSVEVLPSWFMHYKSTTYPRKANTAGKVDQDTQTNNTTGAILGVRFDQWKLAYKRKLTMETTRFANSDSWEITALMRVGLGYRDTEASAISYNVGI